MKTFKIKSRVYPNELEGGNIETNGDAKELFLSLPKNLESNSSETTDDWNLVGVKTIDDQHLPGHGTDRHESIHVEKNFDSSSEELVNCTVNRGQNKIAASGLNKTGKYRLAKKIHETERDRKIIFADRVEGHSDIWEENYYVETHYSTKDIFGNDEVLAQGLRCKCAIG